MSFNEKQLKTLENIVSLEGACLNATICKDCPFNTECLPLFINRRVGSPSEGDVTLWSKKKRMGMAASALAHYELIEDTHDSSS